MSSGTLLIGLQSGLTIGLLAVGLVLIYKANKFINLAHAQLGTLAALLLAKWAIDWGWNFWLAFAASIAVGTATGVLVDRLLVTPLRRNRSSPLSLLLITVGASQLLLGLCLIPALGPNQTTQAAYPQPFQIDPQVGGVVLSGMDLMTLILVPAVVVTLALFLRYSSTGQQIRAVANNEDAARLCGISVRKVSAVTWGLAGALSALAAVLAAPGQSSADVAGFGPYLLMLTLGAAAVGAFVSIPQALIGGLLLGETSSIVAARYSSQGTAELAAFLVILAVVLLRGKAIGRVFASAGSIRADVAPLRVPAALTGSRLLQAQRLVTGPVAVLVCAAVPFLPFLNNDGDHFLLIILVVYSLLGVSLTMLMGWAGQLSLGQFAVAGLGAFVTARLVPDGWSLPAIFAAAALVGAAAMVVVGVPALRVRGYSLAVTTLGLAVIAQDWLFQRSWLSPSNPSGALPPARLARGVPTPTNLINVYFISLAVLIAVVMAATALRHSSPGRLVIAVRDNERASASFGIAPPTIKVAVLVVSGAVAGVAGVLYADAYRYVTPDQFDPGISVALLAIPVIGGLGSIRGAVCAAIVIYAPALFLQQSLSDALGSWGVGPGPQLVLSSVILVAVVMRVPAGIGGSVQRVWQAFLDRRDESASDDRGSDPAAALSGQLTQRHTTQPAPDGGPIRARESGPWSRRIEKLAGGPRDNALALSLNGVRWRVGGLQVLNCPDLRIEQGQIVGLIGPNGAGKTTTMNAVSGVLSPDQGSIEIFGREVTDLPAAFRTAFGAARSFQDATLFAGLTVTETIQVALSRRYRTSFLAAACGLWWARMAERNSAAEAHEIVNRFGLRPWAGTLTAELSTGTRRICDLAAQVATRPALLLLDEPTGGVAQRDAEAFGPLIRDVRDELDCTILIIEHDMPMLMGVCDRIYAMESGAVIAQGSPQEIRRDPRVIESYLGSEITAIDRSDAKIGRYVTKNEFAAATDDGAQR